MTQEGWGFFFVDSLQHKGVGVCVCVRPSVRAPFITCPMFFPLFRVCVYPKYPPPHLVVS